MAYVIVAGRRIRHEKAQDLNLNATAAQSTAKAIKEASDRLLSGKT